MRGRGIDDQVGNAELLAARHADERVPWSDPREALRRSGQIDSDRATTADRDRCGAASVVGGLLLTRDPQRSMAQARDALRSELPRFARPSERPDARTSLMNHEALLSQRMLSLLPERTSDWTNRDVARFQEAVYHFGRAEDLDAHSADGPFVSRSERESGLTGAEVHRLTDRLWHETPTLPTGATGSPRVPVSVDFVGPVAGSSYDHFVLATRDARLPGGARAVAFDPWPEENGSNFVMGDGPDRRVAAGSLSSRTGFDVGMCPTDGRTVGSRSEITTEDVAATQLCGTPAPTVVASGTADLAADYYSRSR